MARMGRPPIKPRERQNRFVVLRLKPADRKALERAAHKAKMSVSDVINEIMDALHLAKAHVIGHSIGGYWALVFALAHPERVNKLVLIGEPAGSSPPAKWKPPVANKETRMPQRVTMRDTRRAWINTTVAHLERVDSTLIEADNANANIAGYATSWNSMLDELVSEKDLGLTYGLRPELKNLGPSTLFIWGDKDFWAAD